MRFELFENIFSDATSDFFKVRKDAYLDKGKFPVIDQGQEFIGGYTDDDKIISKPIIPLILFGDHTKAFKYVDFPFTIGADGIKVLKLKNESYVPLYFYYYFKSIKLVDKGYSRHFKYLKDKKIPVPENIFEQKHIANILTQAETLITQRKQSIALLDEYLKSTFLEMFGDPVRNEKGWKVNPLGYFGKWKSGGTPSRKIREYFNGNIPWLISGELNEMFVSQSSEKITEEAIRNSNATLIPPKSILLGMYDTAALKSSINTIQVTCNQAIAFSRLNDKLCNTIFIYKLIQIGKEHFRRLRKGVRQKNMNLQMIKEIEIITPPIILQNQFAQIVEKTEALKEQYKTSLQELENLYASLSQKAFKGELALPKAYAIDEPVLSVAAEPEMAYEKTLTKKQAFLHKLMLASHIVYQLCEEKTFGHTKLMKLLYLCEQASGMALQTNFKKFAAGPFDGKMLTLIDLEFQKNKWFEIVKTKFTVGGKEREATSYRKTDKSLTYQAHFNRYFATEEETINNLVELFRKTKTETAEIVATLYFAWKEMLEKKTAITEANLVAAFYKFHPEKKKFTKEQILADYHFMLAKSIFPV